MQTITLKNEYQELTILNIGATIHEWKTFSDQRNIVISNEDLNIYKEANMGYLNQTIGRVANRIKNASFTLNSKTYQLTKNADGIHHAHGGPSGFFMRPFDIAEVSKHMVKLKYISKHLEEGYPGELTLCVTYELIKDQFKISYDATTTEDTIINITNHAHFNLSEEETVLNHELALSADTILELDKDLIPTGKYLKTKNTAFDLNTFRKLGDVILSKEVQHLTKGLDHMFMFNKKQNQIHLKYKDKNLIIKTTYPGVQIYSMNYMLTQKLLNRNTFKPYTGIAFEAQFEPNAINIAHFNQPILKKGQQYHHEILYHTFEK